MLGKMRTIIAVFLAGASFTFLQTVRGQQKDGPPELKADGATFKGMYDRLQPVDIHGKVIDQEGNVVAGAQVRIGWESANRPMGNRDPGQTSWVTSDAFGLWEFHIEKPVAAFANDARKPGYEYVFTPESHRDLVAIKTAGNDPVIVHVRKKGETTFLIVGPAENRNNDRLIRVVSPHSEASNLDLLTEKIDKSGAGGYVDLHVAVDYGETTGKWTVTYSAPNGTDGIVMGNDRLYEAPEKGYQKEVVLNGPPWPRFLYLRSRTPEIYSRLDLDYSTRKESATTKGFRISYKAWTNPYGERNLEYDTDFEVEWRLAHQLEDDAKTALRQGKLPLKPDLPKLIKEVKDKAEKDKGKP